MSGVRVNGSLMLYFRMFDLLLWRVDLSLLVIFLKL